MKKIIIGAVALVALLGACGIASSGGGEDAPSVATSNDPDGNGLSTVGDGTTDQVEDSVDVALELAESGQDVADAMNEGADLAGQAGAGIITMDEYATEIDDEIRMFYSQRTYWEHADVPAELDESRDHYVEALKLFHESFTLSQDGARTGNIGLLNEATELMMLGTEELTEATAAVPATLG